MSSLYKAIFEAVLGLVETITIQNIGTADAKVDSGNGAYNVLHGIDVIMGDGVVEFTTIHNKRVKLKVIETIDINIGSGNIEKRPVVALKIKVGGKVYNNVKFSIADRAENEHQILLGKDFIEQLGGLIDVTKSHVVSH